MNNKSLELYKAFFHEIFQKNNIFQFEKVFAHFKLTYPEAIGEEHNEIAPLKEWHHYISEQLFLAPLLDLNFHELIFHSESEISLQFFQEKRFFTQHLLSKDDYQLSLEILALKNGQKWNYLLPFVSFGYLLHSEQMRITLVHSSLDPQGKTKFFIRKSYQEQLKLDQFKLSSKNVFKIQELLDEKANILIAGATGSGKTTFLKTLLSECPVEEHVIILEDTHEITPQRFTHTNLLSDPSNADKSLKAFLSYAMRMSPDRLIIGEMRSHEVIPYVLAMNTGHRGLMSTIHANSALDALHRLTLLFSLYQENNSVTFDTILKLITQSLDYVVFMNNKTISQIIKVQGAEGNKIIYQDVYAN